MTAECVFAAGTLTDAGVIATSLPLPNTPSPPLRSSLNVVVSTVVALTSRSNATVIDAGSVVTVAPGNGDTGDTRIAALLACVSCAAPLVCHGRIVWISVCGRGGMPVGIRAPLAAV